MKEIFSDIISELYESGLEVELTRPDSKFGDFATNAALILAKKVGKNPRQIAEEIADKLRETAQFTEVSVAGPGFINVRLKDKFLADQAKKSPEKIYQNLNYVTEYSCPNAFKELHTGHLYQTILGDAIARLIEKSGAKVSRTSFGGDVGMHVAKCMYGVLQAIGGENLEKLEQIEDDEFARANWISQRYVEGSRAYEEDELAKEEIHQLNSQIYKIHENSDEKTPLSEIYFLVRQWSFDYFEKFYELIGVDGLRYYPESSTTQKGLELVSKLQQSGDLVESDGAIIFPEDKEKNLETRVFVTRQGIPTYETKDLGVIFQEREDYDFDRRFLITGSEQASYMKVVFAAADKIQPGIAEAMTHITNGLVKFADGKKMSSRLGNVARATDAIEAVKARVREIVADDENLVEQISLGALKYQFLKYRVGSDILFDIEESVSLNGNSGPYLQYAHARVCGILSKAPAGEGADFDGVNFDEAERSLTLKLGEYAEVFERSARELMPHHLCNYLYELTQEFNRFYEKSRVIGDARQGIRLEVVRRYKEILSDGLRTLGIATPERV